MFELLKECLDLMTYSEQFWMAVRDHGANSPPALVAQGKLFIAVHKFRRQELKKKLLASLDRLNSAERGLSKMRLSA